MRTKRQVVRKLRLKFLPFGGGLI